MVNGKQPAVITARMIRQGCTRAMQAGATADAKESAKRKLQTWCLMATLFDRKRHHMSAIVRAADVLPREVLDQRLADLAPPPVRPRTDEELDEEEHEALPKAKAKAKGKKKETDKELPATKKTKKRKRSQDTGAMADAEAAQAQCRI